MERVMPPMKGEIVEMWLVLVKNKEVFLWKKISEISMKKISEIYGNDDSPPIWRTPPRSAPPQSRQCIGTAKSNTK